MSASTTETAPARRRTPEVALAEPGEFLAAGRPGRIPRFHRVSMRRTIPPVTVRSVWFHLPVDVTGSDQQGSSF